jgi:hypothetical protein
MMKRMWGGDSEFWEDALGGMEIMIPRRQSESGKMLEIPRIGLPRKIVLKRFTRDSISGSATGAADEFVARGNAGLRGALNLRR